MDQDRIALLTQWMTHGPSRRDVLRGLSAAGLGLTMTRLPHSAAAKKKHHKHKKGKPKKATPNEFGCLEVNDPCTSEADCCSGICEGTKGKRQCRAHDAGTCKQDGQLVPCNNRTDCGCFRTTAGSDICSELFGPSDCAPCQRDADCEALGFPSGSACGLSPVPCASGMACFVPCGTVIPEA